MTESEPALGSDAAARLAFREIRAVMRRYGLNGFAALQSKQRAFFVREFAPWQAVTQEGDSVRVRLKRTEEPDQDTYNDKATHTASTVYAMRDMLSREALTYGQLAELLDQKWDIDYQPLSDFNPEIDQ